MMNNKLLWVEKFASIAGFIIFASLAFIALTEKEISTGSPKSNVIIHSTGFNAIFMGFFFLGATFACLGYLLKYTAFYRVYFLVAFIIWLAFIAWYFVYQL
ncbi:MAG: hypothetical protein DSZ29_02375 [Aquificaceae bacterium]|nr:MAG: hypothetical protein DSZ29_02375 [Aquificaceae bacterium]